MLGAQSLLSSTLTRYFSHIISNLPEIQFSWWKPSIDLELSDVYLNPDALSNLLGKDCGIRLEYGRIGHFKISIPWRQLLYPQMNSGASSCVILLEDVILLLTPDVYQSEMKDNKDDPMKERHQKEKLVQSLIQSILLEAGISPEKGEGNDDDSNDNDQQRSKSSTGATNENSRWKSSVKALLKNLLANLEVHVQNVHVRYEDPGDILGFGIFRSSNDTESSVNKSWNMSFDSDNHNPFLSSKSLIGNEEIIQQSPRSANVEKETSQQRQHRQHRQQRRKRYRPPLAIGIKLRHFDIKTVHESIPKATTALNLDANAKNMSDHHKDLKDKTHVAASESSDKVKYQERHKLADAKDLSIYWDSHAPLIYQAVSNKRQKERRSRRKQKLSKLHSKDDHRDSNLSDHQTSQLIKCETKDDEEIATTTGKENSKTSPSEYYGTLFSCLDGSIPDNDAPEDSILERFIHHCHSYLIQPISPTLHFTIVDTLGDGLENQEPVHSVPHSRAVLNLPPIHLCINSSTLRDLAYLRKSISVHSKMKLNVHCNKVAFDLIKKRPKLPVRDDIKGWWKYCVSGSLLMRKLTEHKYTSVSKKELPSNKEVKTRKCGWRNFFKVFQLRKRYIVLYDNLLSSDEESKSSWASQITELEKELTVHEICAFRLFVFREILRRQNNPNSEINEDRSMDSKWVGSWLWRNNENTNRNEKNDNAYLENMDKNIRNDFTKIFSAEYREWQVYQVVNVLRKNDLNESSLLLQPNHASIEVNDESESEARQITKQRFVKFEFSINCHNLLIQASAESRNESKSINRESTNRHTFVHSPVTHQPILLLCCAFAQHFVLYRDSSLESKGTIASLEAVDLLGFPSVNMIDTNFLDAIKSPHRRLLSRKTRRIQAYRKESNTYSSKDENDQLLLETPFTDIDESPVIISNKNKLHCISVTVRKDVSHHTDSTVPDSKDLNETREKTKIDIIVSPMEMVYSIAFMEAFSSFLSALKTPELVNDYHRVSQVVSQWQAKQTEKIMKALAKRNKTMSLKIDIAAPVLLVPEESSKAVLVLDLGRLKFNNSNDDSSHLSIDHEIDHLEKYDDLWNIALTNMQVLCASASTDQALPTVGTTSSTAIYHPLVEPFSIEFLVKTKFGSSTNILEESKGDGQNKTQTATHNHIFIRAVLPRLVFNFTSSTVRVVSRLRTKRSLKMIKESKYDKDREKKISDSGVDFSTKDQDNSLPQNEEERKAHAIKYEDQKQPTKTHFKFEFSAPLIKARLDNDVDGRDSDPTKNIVTPISELTISGIGGHIYRLSTESGDTFLRFSARLRSLQAIDLYQQAGNDYSVLLSSQYPETVNFADTTGNLTPTFLYNSANVNSFKSDLDSNFDSSFDSDLVMITYEKETINHRLLNRSVEIAKKTPEELQENLVDIQIKFNELYMEWNPETIAAIQKAMRRSSSEKIKALRLIENAEQKMSNLSKQPNHYVAMNPIDESKPNMNGDEAFFDAFEDELDESFSETEEYFLSEVSSEDNDEKSPAELPTFSPILFMVRDSFTYDFTALKNEYHTIEDEVEQKNSVQTQSTTTNITFELSKLVIKLNKESRKRRLVTVEMKNTSVKYETKLAGGSKTNATIGNLTFIDSATLSGDTMYGEILGLRNDLSNKVSLVQLEYESFPCSPEIVSITNNDDERREMTVINGCDRSLKIHFSPMKFVYFQQLWLEIVDYFFEGIIGDRIFGRIPEQENSTKKPEGIVSDSSRQEKAGAATRRQKTPRAEKAIDFKVTKFDICLDSPTIVIPVSYCSPNYIRLSLSQIKVQNHFKNNKVTHQNSEIFKDESPNESYLQWYNNCDVLFTNLQLTTWNGSQLLRHERGQSCKGVNTFIKVKWPVGPRAPLVTPKWNIHCTFESMQ